MKQMKLKYIGLVFTILVFSECNIKNSNNEIKKENILTETQMETTIRVKGILTSNGAVGYGNTFICKIEKVLEGNIQQETFNLVVLAGDEREKFVNSHLSPISVEITFRKKDENVEYAMMPLTGFVDENRTSWEIETIK